MESLWMKFHLKRMQKKKKSLMNELEHKYEYLFSLKEFGNSQVQRGHQNANKMKRIKKKKEFSFKIGVVALIFYLYPLQS